MIFEWKMMIEKGYSRYTSIANKYDVAELAADVCVCEYMCVIEYYYVL